MVTCPTDHLAEHQISTLFYLAPLENVPTILACGIFSNDQALDVRHRNASWNPVQERRQAALPFNSLTIHGYVPLFFVPDTPMQFVLTHETRNSLPLLRPEELAVLELDARTVFGYDGTIFTNGNAASHGTRFFTDLSDLDQLDWQIIRNRLTHFGREHKRRKSAEVLVPYHIPVDAVSGVVVYNDRALDALADRLAGVERTIGRFLPIGWREAVLRRCRADSAHFV